MVSGGGEMFASSARKTWGRSGPFGKNNRKIGIFLSSGLKKKKRPFQSGSIDFHGFPNLSPGHPPAGLGFGARWLGAWSWKEEMPTFVRKYIYIYIHRQF